MYRFVCRGWNCGKYIDACMHSLRNQTLTNWTATLILDLSEDDTFEKAKQWITDDGKITVEQNIGRMGVCTNMWNGIKYCKAESEDVICILDLDDMLYGNDALEVVNNYYVRYPNLLCTYGSYIKASTGNKGKICKAYHKDIQVRQEKWRATHLKTFKMKVFQTIPQEYFIHNDKWGVAASDLALMFSVIERAGIENCKHIPAPLYWYRDKSPITLNRGTQRKWEWIWRQKKPLEKLF